MSHRIKFIVGLPVILYIHFVLNRVEVTFYYFEIPNYLHAMSKAAMAE